MLPLPLTLIALVALSLLRRRMEQAATAFILLSNWTIAQATVNLTGEFYPVWCLAPVDYLTGIAFFIIRRSHWQSAIIAVYGAQLIAHAAYIHSDMGIAATYYGYWLLTYLAWLQVALIGGWIAGDAVHAWLHIYGRRPRSSRSNHLALLEESAEP